MGYSCTVAAHDVIRRTLNTINNQPLTDYNHPNTWEINGKKFFYERGTEQADGSITGSIYLMITETQCRKYGSVKINADGTLHHWAGMPKSKIICRVKNAYPVS
jgi:hypothetical protein